ncbi:MAG: hypothetical protein R3F34_17060 [Planctomycetota bacterium]
MAPESRRNDLDREEPLPPERLRRLEEALTSLTRAGVPDALRRRLDDERRLEAEGASTERVGAERVAAALAMLHRVEVPAELRERFELERGSRSPVAELVGGLERVHAPRVLRRLVAEEVAKSDAVVERFSRSLTRMRLPRESGAGLPSSWRSREHEGAWWSSRGVVRRFASAAVIAVAIGLVAWNVRGSDEPKRPEFRFTMREAGALDELHPITQGLARAYGAVGFVADRATFGGGR